MKTSLLFYNNKQTLCSVIKLAYFSYHDHSISIEELPSGNGYADIAYHPKKNSSLPALSIELKWSQSADTAVAQVKEKHYPDVLAQYTDNIILAGISYDKNDPRKSLSCRIEKY